MAVLDAPDRGRIAQPVPALPARGIKILQPHDFRNRFRIGIAPANLHRAHLFEITGFGAGDRFRRHWSQSHHLGTGKGSRVDGSLDFTLRIGDVAQIQGKGHEGHHEHH